MPKRYTTGQGREKHASMACVSALYIFTVFCSSSHCMYSEKTREHGTRDRILLADLPKKKD
jgi:hypothetical protein